MFGSSIDFLTHRAKDITQTNQRSIKRIVAGDNAQELAAMDRKTGTLGRVIRISADNMSKQDSIRFFQNAMSFMKFQEETIEYARQLYSQMHALAQEAQSDNISVDERAILDDKFSELRKLAVNLNNLKFNGESLFDELAGSIEYDIDFASGLFRSDSAGREFKTFTNTQDVVYNKGILVLDVNTGGWGEHFVFGYVDEIPEQNELQNADPADPLAGISPIFNSSKNVEFVNYSSAPTTKTWDTDGGAATSDFDRFFIEWGPDQDTSFRFIPLSEGIDGSGYVSDPANPATTIDDGDFNNRTKYLQNLGLPPATNPSLNDRGIPDVDWDSTFEENYKFLKKQNPVDENYNLVNNPSGSPDYSRIFLDSSEGATRMFFNTQGDVEVSASDPSSTIMQLRVNSRTIYQVRAQYFKPDVENTDVGNIGDLETIIKPLGLGLLRDKSNNNAAYDLKTYSNAISAFEGITEELNGLTEQMGILGNNMARVLSSMEAVDKQLGIQRDLIAVEPEQVVLDELENLSYAREMRSFNASLMNKVVQINHDMIDLLLQ